MNHKEIEDYLLAKPGAKLTYPFGKETAVYKVGDHASEDDDDAKMFALVAEGREPVRISLKCDPLLAETLRDKYETVMPGYHLNKKHWNTLLLTGQLSEGEVHDLIDLSYRLVLKSLPKRVQDDLAPEGIL